MGFMSPDDRLCVGRVEFREWDVWCGSASCAKHMEACSTVS